MRNTRSKSSHGTKKDGLLVVKNNNEILMDPPHELDPANISPSIWDADGSCLFPSMDPACMGQRKRIAILIESVILAVQENTFGELTREYELSDLEAEEVEPLPNEYTVRATGLIANKNISESFKEGQETCLPTETNVPLQVESIPIQEQVNRNHNELSPTKLKGSQESVGNAGENLINCSRVGQDLKIEADFDSEISIVFVGKGNFNCKATDNVSVTKHTNHEMKNVSSTLAAPSVLLNTVVTIPIDIDFDNSAVRSDIKQSSSETLKSSDLKSINPVVLLKRLKMPVDVLPVTLNSAVIQDNLPSILPMNIQIEQQQSTKFIAAEKNKVHQIPEASCTAEDKFSSPVVTSKLIYVDPVDLAPSSSIVNSKIEIQHKRATSSSVKPKSKWCLQYGMTAEESKATNDKKTSTETGKFNNLTPKMPMVRLPLPPPAHVTNATSSRSVHSEFTDPAPERSKTLSPSSSISKEAPLRNDSCTTVLGAEGIVSQEITSVDFPAGNKLSRSQSVAEQPKPIAAKLNSRSKPVGATGTGGRPCNHKVFEDYKSQVQLATFPVLSYEECPHESALSTSLSRVLFSKENKSRTSENTSTSTNDCVLKTNPEVAISKNSFWMGTKKVKKLSWWAVKVDDRLSQTMADLPSVPLSTCNQNGSRKRKLDSSDSVKSKTYKLELDDTNQNKSKAILCDTTVSPPMLSVNKKEIRDKIFSKQGVSILSANEKLSMWQGGKKNKIRWDV